MQMEKTVCNCMAVTIDNIADAIKNGATTFEEVKKVTKVSCGCHRCEEYARNVTAELLEEYHY